MDSVRVFEDVGDLLDLVHEDLFNRERVTVVDHREFKFERGAAVFGRHKCVSADLTVFSGLLGRKPELVSVVVVSHVFAENRLLLVLGPAGCDSVSSLLQGDLAQSKHQGALAGLEET